MTRKRNHRYHPRAIVANPMQLAMQRASKAPAADVDSVLAPVTGAFQALREGVASELQWQILASSVEVALAIERRGVVRGLAEHLASAEDMLQQIRRRAMATGAWRPTPLFYQELDALREYIPLHRFQLEQLSRGEVIQAMDQAEAIVRSAGGCVVEVDQLPTHQQLELLGTRAAQVAVSTPC